MLKFQLATPQDLRAAAKVEHKRQIEEARKSRIFNPRSRRIGIDKEFLDKQVEEKKQLAQLEKEKEYRMDEQLVRSSRLAMMLEKREEEEKRKINKEINTFRTVYQRPEDRRDFDLYDPDILKKTMPARVRDEDPRLGLASAQKFEGEDENAQARARVLKEQMQSWLEQQTQERRKAEKELKDADEAYQNAVVARDKRAVMLEGMEHECRRKLNETTAKFNKALAEEQEYRRRRAAVQDEEDKMAEIYNHVTGDFLTEAPEQAASNRGPDKPLASRYKGMSAAELKAFRDVQAIQMEEITKMRQAEKCRDEEWDKQMSGNAHAAVAFERELERKKRQISKQVAEENLQLAEAQKSHQDYLNRVVYKNKPTAAFFEQFNKGTR
ncbi:RIB43A-like with coiled-coils protein 2 [Neodiprion lecontei]|uniref:RIB43A-like with coiled-coils protein 2 n=1 Tax=Neodiprion lecontei TaxID=441921 RepID=A0A6J0BPW8_NEOLC|nr:RIB43A-like with coiled-coils protein 2 [Neodiprion lecontei]XP_046466365.1 RIB43A-like with coiled-coils protein 2 [Neodiprion pinetum]